jgi:hypothetical protein
MKGVRFYLEHKTPQDKRRGKHSGNVCAVVLNHPSGNHPLAYKSGPVWCYEAICGIFDRPNSEVAGTGVSINGLRENCKRIPESKAREIHPNLFRVLDSQED